MNAIRRSLADAARLGRGLHKTLAPEYVHYPWIQQVRTAELRCYITSEWGLFLILSDNIYAQASGNIRLHSNHSWNTLFLDRYAD